MSANRVVDGVVRIHIRRGWHGDAGRHRKAARGNAAVIPDQHHVRGAVPVRDLPERPADRSAGHAVQGVGILEWVAAGRAAGPQVEAVRATEHGQVILDVRADEAAGNVVVERLGQRRAGPIVERGPPDLVRPARVERRRQQGAVPPEVRALATDRELPGNVLIRVQGQRNLMEVVQTLDAVGGRPDLLDGGQEQANQDRNNGDDDEKFDQGISGSAHDRILLSVRLAPLPAPQGGLYPVPLRLAKRFAC